ncbi:bifunctional 3-(3-hydroxy-phenyl)propionate/3-hydroxycinnamic acid hydroxylase [Streptomyces violaceusniger]
MTPPVTIVGAGPIGLTAALLLARRDISSLIVERHATPYPLPRAVHMDGEVLRILQEAGVADAFHAISRPMPGLRLVDADLRTMAEFRRDARVGPSGHPEASMFDQPALERVLLAAVEADPRVTVHRGAEVTAVEHRPNGVTVRWQDDTGAHRTQARAVLGCDGAGSTVRAALDIGVRDLGYTEPWLVVDVRSSRPLPMWDGVHQVCDSQRAATFMHLVGDRYRWEFRVLDTDDIEHLTSPAGVHELIAPWMRASGHDDIEIVRCVTYTFRARVAERWRERRVFLLGDAAHQTPPFIGQGLGAGLRDAHNLVWKLERVLRGDADDTLLDTYQAERERHAVKQIRAAIMVGWALTGGNGHTAALRRQVVRALCRIPAVSKAALSSTSPRLRLDGRRRPSVVGRQCPQSRTEAGWFDDRLGDGFALVTLDPQQPMPRDVTVVAVRPNDPVGRWLIRHRVRTVLVRPDKVVCATGRTWLDLEER